MKQLPHILEVETAEGREIALWPLAVYRRNWGSGSCALKLLVIMIFFQSVLETAGGKVVHKDLSSPDDDRIVLNGWP